MTTLTRNAKSRLVHKLLAAAVLVAGLGTITLASTPAFAHDGWYGGRGEWRGHEWREHEWREHEWREHGGWGRPHYGYYRYGYAPGYYYAPPPGVDAPPPPPASFNRVVPLNFR